MMVASERFLGGYYRNEFGPPGESEGSGSSGRTDTEITASEYSSAPARKSMSLSLKRCKNDTFGVPLQVLSLSRLSRTERKDLMRRLNLELEQIRNLQKRVELQKMNGAAVSSSGDILFCSTSNAQNWSGLKNYRDSSVVTAPKQGKKPTPSTSKARPVNRDTPGKFGLAKLVSAPNAANMLLMKQCDNLLKRLMDHQFAWVFNSPVDAVKLNIPDYFDVIKHPMDLGTVKSKIASGAYSGPLDFAADVRLTFNNAMTYNPPGNDVHVMANTLIKFFEVRWKSIEKKLTVASVPSKERKEPPTRDFENLEVMSPLKKRRTGSSNLEVTQQTVNKIMTSEEKQRLGTQLESLLGEVPAHIIDFLRTHSSGGTQTEDNEIEIDIDDLSDDTLFSLQKLLDDYLQEKQNSHSKPEPCEIEMLNVSGLSNSSMQQGKGIGPVEEEVDIGGDEPPVSSYPVVDIGKSGLRRPKSANSDSDTTSSSDSDCDSSKAANPSDKAEIPDVLSSEAVEKIGVDTPLEKNQCVSELGQLNQASRLQPLSVESDCQRDGDYAPIERQISPEKRYRAAILKNKFADTILKAREKALKQGEKGDPEKLRREREELELQRKKEKARLQAEAKAAEDARRRAEEKAAAEAAVEARRKRELEREAARQALLQMEKTVEINENAQLLEDLEMLRAVAADQIPSSVDETSPDNSQDALGSFQFGFNPLEQLGLYRKDDEEEEEGEPMRSISPANEEAEGEATMVMFPANEGGNECELMRAMNPANEVNNYGEPMETLNSVCEEEEEFELMSTLNPTTEEEEEGGLISALNPAGEEEEEGELMRAMNPANEEEESELMRAVNPDVSGEGEGEPVRSVDPVNEEEDEGELTRAMNPANEEEQSERRRVVNPDIVEEVEGEPVRSVDPVIEEDEGELMRAMIPANEEEESEPTSAVNPDIEVEGEGEPVSSVNPVNEEDEEGEPMAAMNAANDDKDGEPLSSLNLAGDNKDGAPMGALNSSSEEEEEGELMGTVNPTTEVEKGVLMMAMDAVNEEEDEGEPMRSVNPVNEEDVEGERMSAMNAANEDKDGEPLGAMNEDKDVETLTVVNEDKDGEPLTAANDEDKDGELLSAMNPATDAEEGEVD